MVRTPLNFPPIPRFSRASEGAGSDWSSWNGISASIGKSVSHGCIRMTNTDITASQLSCRSEPRSRSSEGRRSQVAASCGVSLRRSGNELLTAPASPTLSDSSVHPTMSQAAASGGPPAINTQNRARLSVRSHPEPGAVYFTDLPPARISHGLCPVEGASATAQMFDILRCPPVETKIACDERVFEKLSPVP